MQKTLLDKVHNFIITLALIIGIIFALFVIAQAGRLIYEYINYPAKSKQRFEEIHKKLERESKSVYHYFGS